MATTEEVIFKVTTDAAQARREVAGLAQDVKGAAKEFDAAAVARRQMQAAQQQAAVTAARRQMDPAFAAAQDVQERQQAAQQAMMERNRARELFARRAAGVAFYGTLSSAALQGGTTIGQALTERPEMGLGEGIKKFG